MLTTPMPPWMANSRGQRLSVLQPDPESLRAEALAPALAKVCRFAGHAQVHYSVAQHSVLVATMVWDRGPLAALYALLHDAHEVVTGDIPAPTKAALALLSVDGARALASIERRVQAAVHRANGLPAEVPPEIAAAIAAADRRALVTEWRDVMPANAPALPGDWPAPWRAAIKPQRWDVAEDRWLAMHGELAATAAATA
jgi:hypothetical protein